MLHRRSVLLAGPALLLARGRVQAQSMQAQSMQAQSTPEQDLAAILRERVDIGRDTMGHRRRDDRQRPAQRHRLWAIRLRSPARCRHGVRDRLDHKSAHLAIVGRHGAARRGGGGRPCVEISARQRQDAGFRGRADYAAGPRDLHVGPAADAVEFRAEGSGPIPTSITRPSGSTTTCRTTSSASSRARTSNIPISASACWAISSSCAPARATRNWSSRASARRSAWTTPASPSQVRCDSAWRRATTLASRRYRIGIFWRLRVPARFVQRRTTC